MSFTQNYLEINQIDLVTKTAVTKCFSNSIFAAMNKLKTVFRYLKYLFAAKTRYDVHGPFIFDFINQVIKDRRHYYAFDEIESRRDSLLANEATIIVEDFGAGSKVNKTPERKISAIAKNTLITPRFGQLMFRIVQNRQPETILEIGTSLGISTLYLAKAAPLAKLITLEGSKSVADIAQQQFNSLVCSNISIITGEFSATLPSALSQLQTLDLAFVDGNHRFAPTIDYFEQLKPYLTEKAIVIFDDIHWSDEMEKAWNTIKADPKVTLSIDLFFKGIVLFSKDFHHKAHYTVRFP